MQQDQRKKNPKDIGFFTEYGEANRYKILEVIGKGSYGVVCAAIDTHTGEKVAIKKITDIFEHISDAIRILREIKLLRMLRHPDIVEIKRIMLPPSRREFKDIYVVFELMESDLHQVIKANDDLTHEHHRFFLYQMLRALKYMHTANVYHRDLKPKNILANANCKLKICDFGLARVAFSDTPTTIFWTDYVATRWYRAPELCGSFFSKYTPAIDIWSIGCIFAEVLTGKPLFPGKSVVHQLDLITDLLGSPSAETISGVRNEKARKYLTDMHRKQPVVFSDKFQKADPLALPLLKKLLAFDPKDRPTAEQALADPYFNGLAKVEREPSCQPISKIEFEFERRRITKEDIRELIFREILEYHPQLLKDYKSGNEGANFVYPSAVGQFRRQFAYLEENSGKSGPVIPPERKHVSLPRSTVNSSTIAPKPQQPQATFDNRRTADAASNGRVFASSGNVFRTTVNSSTVSSKPQHSLTAFDNRQAANNASNSSTLTFALSGNVFKTARPPPRMPTAKPGRVVGPVLPYEGGRDVKDGYEARVISGNGVLPPQALSPQYIYRTTGDPGGKNAREAEKDSSSYKVLQQQHSQGRASPGVSIDMNNNLYYQHPRAQSNGQVTVDLKLVHAQSQFSVAGAAAVAIAAHRETGTVQFGLS